MDTISPKHSIRLLLIEALSMMNVKSSKIVLEYPDDVTFGHYASPISMGLSKILKRNPQEIAQELKIILSNNEMFERIEIAGPGYLNFFLSEEYLAQKLSQILSQELYGSNQYLLEAHILLEYVSANPTGPLHIGHGRWAAVGDSLARILKFSGATVFREFYVNDAGVQISHLNESIKAVQSGQSVPEDGYRGVYIKELSDCVTQTGIAPEVLMQESQKQTLIKFCVEFDQWFSEKSLYQNGSLDVTLSELKQKNVVYTQDGALWFRSTEYSKDDKDRVIIKSNGSYTYLASDIAYHRDKIKRGFPILINILGFDHHGYVERISAAVQVLGGELTVLLGQMVNLFRDGEPVRMSKRTGDIITLDEVIEEIGTDATRYSLLRRPMNSSVDFDLETVKTSSDDNPVFYVQYAHARISSILRNTVLKAHFEKFIDVQERLLVIELIKFEDLILDIAQGYDIHKLTSYLESLSSIFHRFYRSCRILDDPQEKSRLAICIAVKRVLHRGLDLLGVSAPEKMESRG